MKLKGKNVLITGASSGIGRAFALRCAQEAELIILSARDKEKLQKVKKEIEEVGGKAIVITCDVTNSSEVKKLFLEASKGSRRLDVIFSNVGLGFVKHIWDQTVEEIESMIDVNTKGMIYVCKYAAEILRRQKCGHLLLTSSLAGLISVPQWSTYVASKWAVTGFADSIRFELEPYGVEVTSIHPGLVDTEFFGKGKAEISKKELKENSISPEEVADEIYKTLFSKKQKVVVPSMAKNYYLIEKYLPQVSEKLLKSKVKNVGSVKGDKDSIDFSYVKSIKCN